MALSSAQAALFVNLTKLTIIYSGFLLLHYVPNYVPVHYNIVFAHGTDFPFSVCTWTGLVLFRPNSFIILCVLFAHVGIGSAFALLWFGTNSRNHACIEDSILYPWGNSKGQLTIGLHVERVLLWATSCALKWSVPIEEGSVGGWGKGWGGDFGNNGDLEVKGSIFLLLFVLFSGGFFWGLGVDLCFFVP